MGSHFNRAARDDGAQGSLRTRARRRLAALREAENLGLAEVLSAAELDYARKLARAATPAIMKQLIVDSLTADTPAARTAAGKAVMVVGWGAEILKGKALASAKAPVLPGSITINVMGPAGELPAQTRIVDVGAIPVEIPETT